MRPLKPVQDEKKSLLREQVFAIAAAILEAGEVPTVLKIQRRLGGGANDQIRELLVEWIHRARAVVKLAAETQLYVYEKEELQELLSSLQAERQALASLIAELRLLRRPAAARPISAPNGENTTNEIESSRSMSTAAGRRRSHMIERKLRGE